MLAEKDPSEIFLKKFSTNRPLFPSVPPPSASAIYIGRGGGVRVGELVAQDVVDVLQRPRGVVVLLVEQAAHGGDLLEEAKRTCVSNKLSQKVVSHEKKTKKKKRKEENTHKNTHLSVFSQTTKQTNEILRSREGFGS